MTGHIGGILLTEIKTCCLQKAKSDSAVQFQDQCTDSLHGHTSLCSQFNSMDYDSRIGLSLAELDNSDTPNSSVSIEIHGHLCLRGKMKHHSNGTDSVKKPAHSNGLVFIVEW